MSNWRDSIKKFLRFTFAYKSNALLVSGMAFFTPFVSIAFPFLFRNFIDLLIYGGQFRTAIFWLSMILLAMILSAFGSAFQDYFTEKYKQKITIELRQNFMAHFFKLELGYTSQKGSGYFLQRLQESIQLRDMMIDSFASIVSNLVLFIIVLSSLFAINIWVALIFLFALVPTIWGFIFPQKGIQKGSLELKEIEAKLMEEAQVSFREVEKIKARSLEEYVVSEFRELSSQLYQKAIKLTKWKSGWQGIGAAIPEPFYILAFGVCALEILQGRMTVGTLVAVNWLANLFLQAGLNSFNILSKISSTLPACIRVFEILEKEPEIQDGILSSPLRERSLIPEKIWARDVCFHYPGQEKYVLFDLNFIVEPGEHACLVGKSGSGKSTILKLILRLYDPLHGVIYLGDNALQDYKLSYLRRVVDYLPHEPLFFPGTLMENLQIMNPRMDKKEILNELKRYGFQDFLDSLPNGLYTRLTGEGRELSAGQKQMVALFGAILKGSPILLLDEPTSFLDPFLEVKYQQVLKCYGNKRTLIIIAHRPSTLLWGDHILVLNMGKIEDEGKHFDLLERNQIYREYFKEVSKAEEEKIEPRSLPVKKDSSLCSDPSLKQVEEDPYGREGT